MNAIPDQTVQDLLNSTQQELETLQNKHQQLIGQNEYWGKSYEDLQYKMHELKQDHKRAMNDKTDVARVMFERWEGASREAFGLTEKVEKLEKKISGHKPICSSSQAHILISFPNMKIDDLCPVCTKLNVNCMIGCHPLNADIILAKLNSTNRKRKYEG
jgi:hypothetical protein